MNKAILAAMAALLLTVSAGASEVRGKYLEARNAEIYASHCFANAELGIRGDLAAMAWQIEKGVVDGVTLDGLNVVAVIKASATLGNPFSNPLPIKGMLVFDEQATAEQRAALESFVNDATKGMISQIVNRETAPIQIDFHGDLHAKRATLTAGDFVKVETRAIVAADSLCHLDSIYYAPLVDLDHAMAAHAVEQSFGETGLGVKLNEYRRSSVYLGAFTVADSQVSDD
jgi:hypothetical protein